MCIRDRFYSFNPGANDADSVHARGSYAPVTVGMNSVATCGGGGSTRRKKSASRRRSRNRRRLTKCKKCKCDIIIGVGGTRRHTRFCKHKCCKKNKTRGGRRVSFRQQGGSGSFANAAYSIGGSGTDVGPSTTALANPAPYTAYNSCHPVV